MMTVHAGALALAVWWQPQTQLPEPPPAAAMMIELAPLAAPPSAAAPPPPAPVEKKVEKPPEPEPVKKAEVALPKPKPKPKPVPKVTEEAPPPTPTPAEPSPAPVAAQPAPATPQAASAAAAPAAPVAAPPSSGMATASWQGALRAHLERYKRYPPAAMSRRQQGITYVRFAMSRDGGVAWARLERPSGYSRLDDEALALMDRAQPLPPPPPDVAGQTIEIVVPIEFFMGVR